MTVDRLHQACDKRPVCNARHDVATSSTTFHLAPKRRHRQCASTVRDLHERFVPGELASKDCVDSDNAFIADDRDIDHSRHPSPCRWSSTRNLQGNNLLHREEARIGQEVSHACEP
jgi:hypothetical protein